MPELRNDRAMFTPTPTGRHDGTLSYFVPEPKEWEERAICTQTDPEAFYPEGPGRPTKEAKEVCKRCDVREECLADALARDERWGVWGGLSARERQALKKRAVA